MGISRFLLRRLWAQRLLGVGVVITIAFAIGVVAAGPIYADAARATIVGWELTQAPPPLRDVRVQVYTDPTNWSTVDAAVHASSGSLPVETIVPQGEFTARVGPAADSIQLVFRAGAGDHVTFRSGGPPNNQQVAIPHGLAFATGLGVGDRIAIVGPTDAVAHLEISGTFDPPPRTDPFWFGEESPFPPEDSKDPPPLLVPQDAGLTLARRLGLSTTFTWDLYLDLDGITYEQATPLPDAFARFQRDVQDRVPALTLHTSSGITTLVGSARASIERLTTPIYLVVLQILAVALVVVVGVGTLLASRQSFELAVLHSRGASKRALIGMQLLQTAIATLLALPAGLLIAIGLTHFAGLAVGHRAPGVPFPVRLTSSAVLVAGVAAVVAGLALAAPSVPAVRRTTVDERRRRSREGRTVWARYPIELFVLPLGIVATFELRRGAAAPPTVGGASQIDPLVLFAPTLLIVGCAFVAVRLLSLAVRVMDGRIDRSSRLATYLAGRRLGRAVDVTYATAALIVLSIALLVVSTSFRATMIHTYRDTARAFIGADWVVEVAPSASDTATAIDALPSGMTAVTRFEATGDAGPSSPGAVGFAIDPSTFASGSRWREDLYDQPQDEVLNALETEPVGASIEGASLSMTVDGPAAASGLTMRVASATPDGTIVTSDGQRVAPGRADYVFDISGASRLLSIALMAPYDVAVPPTATFLFRSVAVDGVPLSLDRWTSLRWQVSGGTLRSEDAGWRFEAVLGAGLVVGGIGPGRNRSPRSPHPTSGRSSDPPHTCGWPVSTCRSVSWSRGMISPGCRNRSRSS